MKIYYAIMQWIYLDTEVLYRDYGSWPLIFSAPSSNELKVGNIKGPVIYGVLDFKAS